MPKTFIRAGGQYTYPHGTALGGGTAQDWITYLYPGYSSPYGNQPLSMMEPLSQFSQRLANIDPQFAAYKRSWDPNFIHQRYTDEYRTTLDQFRELFTVSPTFQDEARAEGFKIPWFSFNDFLSYQAANDPYAKALYGQAAFSQPSMIGRLLGRLVPTPEVSPVRQQQRW